MFLATDTHRLTQTPVKSSEGGLLRQHLTGQATILFSPVDLTEENQSALWAIIIELNSKS
jgi:hypothetical protein